LNPFNARFVQHLRRYFMVFCRMQSPRVLRAFLFACAALFSAAALAGNPYREISERNVFHLVPRVPARTQTNPEPLPKIRLTGITTILRGKRALLKVQFPAKPFTHPTEESYILKEGERAGPIQVLQINEKTAYVTVNDSGVVTNLTFDKIPPAPAPAPKLPMARSLVRGRPYGSGYR
jgi:hypothetical protein